MISRPRPLSDARESGVAPRLLAALAAGAGAGITVAVPAVPVPVAVVVVSLALAVIVPLGRSGRAHLVADPDLPPEPEPDDDLDPGPRWVEVVHVMPTARSVRPRPYDDPLLATAEDAGVYRPRHACDTPTGVIPAVPAASASAT